MNHRFGRLVAACLTVAGLLAGAACLHAQVTTAAGYTPPDDTPKINVGITIFADYTYQDTPMSIDGDKNEIHKSSFNLSRAYINVTGSLSHWFSFRITPDIRAETGSGSTLAGNQTFRVKFGRLLRGQVRQRDARPRQDQDLRAPHALQLLINGKFTPS
jgi:hypothetical protein